jgi:hypothetical protein
MLMTQCELGRGNVRMVTWLPHDKRVRIGTVISLNKQEDRWTVLNKSEPVNPEESPIMHGWSVGGL